MTQEEIRLKSLEFAFQYLDYYSSIYKTEHGVIAIAECFEQYINGSK